MTMYRWADGFEWTGAGPEPQLGESREEYLTRVGEPGLGVAFVGVPFEEPQPVAPPAATTPAVGPEPIPEGPVLEAGFPIAGALGWLAAQTGWLGTLGTWGLAGYGLYEMFFDGDTPGPGPISTIGGNGVMVNGGATTTTPATGVINGVPVSGPGVPEPPRVMVARQWVVKVNADKYAGKGETFYMYYFRLIDGRMMCYHPYRGWRIWKPKKPLAVMYRGKTTLSQAVKVQKYLDRMWRTVAKKTKALKLS